MTLIKFIEYQTKDHFLKRMPIEAKISFFILAIIAVFLAYPLNVVLCLALMLVETVLMLVAFRDPLYIFEIYLAYLGLFAFLYIPVLWGKTIGLSDLIRLLNFLAIALSSMFIFASVDTKQLEEFLRRLKIPSKAIATVSLVWNFLPSTYAELNQIIITQKSRGLDLDNPLKKLYYSIAVLVPFLLIALVRLRYLSDALKARGVA